MAARAGAERDSAQVGKEVMFGSFTDYKAVGPAGGTARLGAGQAEKRVFPVKLHARMIPKQGATCKHATRLNSCCFTLYIIMGVNYPFADWAARP